MRFENPWMLAGLVAVGVPLAFHLIYRRRAVRVPLSALHFLLGSRRHLTQRLRIRRWALLLTRCALVAALPLALAKPYVPLPAATPDISSEPSSVVLVIDDAFSSAYRRDEKTLLSRATTLARAIVADLPQSHNVAVVTASEPVRAPVGQLTFDRRGVRQALQALKPSSRPADIEGALLFAERILAESRLDRRVVVLLSNLARNGRADPVIAWSSPRPPQLNVIDLAEGRALPNVGITAATVQPAGAGLGQPSLRVTVLNTARDPWHDVVTVEAGSRVLTAALRVPPFASVTKEFTLDPGLTAGRVRIPPDDLPADNERFFVVERAADVRVLVVDGAPHQVPYLAESFFLSRALAPHGDMPMGLSVGVLGANEWSPGQLRNVDVVVLLNVRGLDDARRVALTNFVAAGGGLLIAAGENVTPETTAGYADLLPFPVRAVRAAAAGAEPPRFAPPAERHPLFAPFAGEPQTSLFSTHVQRYLLLDAATVGPGRVVASLTNGAPLIAEKRVEAGRVLFVTTTLDRDWTDLPIRSGFVPFVITAMRYLAGRLDAAPPATSVVVGAPLVVAVRPDRTRVSVRGPDGRRHELPFTPKVDRSVSFDGTRRPGLYEVELQGEAGAPPRRLTYAVNLDPRGSDTDRFEPRTLLQQSAGPRTAAAAPAERGGAPALPVGLALWPYVLLGLVALLGIEAWLFLKH